MTTVRVWLYPLKNESCFVSCHHLMTTARARLFISKVWNMLRQLSSSHFNGQSMVIYHISLKTCPPSCLHLMTTDKHGYTSQKYESCPTSCLRLMTTVRVSLHPSSMSHALSVAIFSWQRSNHGYFSLRYVTCSVRSHHLMTTVRAWKYTTHVWNMLMLMTTVRAWKYTTHVWNMLMLMTTVRAWLFISKVWNMLPQLFRLMAMVRAYIYIPMVWNMLRLLSSSHENGHSMAIYNSCRKHAPSVVIVSIHRPEYDYTPLSISHDPSVAIISW